MLERPAIAGRSFCYFRAHARVSLPSQTRPGPSPRGHGASQCSPTAASDCGPMGRNLYRARPPFGADAAHLRRAGGDRSALQPAPEGTRIHAGADRPLLHDPAAGTTLARSWPERSPTAGFPLNGAWSFARRHRAASPSGPRRPDRAQPVFAVSLVFWLVMAPADAHHLRQLRPPQEPRPRLRPRPPLGRSAGYCRSGSWAVAERRGVAATVAVSRGNEGRISPGERPGRGVRRYCLTIPRPPPSTLGWLAPLIAFRQFHGRRSTFTRSAPSACACAAILLPGYAASAVKPRRSNDSGCAKR